MLKHGKDKNIKIILKNMDETQLPFVSRKQLSFSEATAFSLIVNSEAKRTGSITISGATKDGVFSFIHSTLDTGATQTSVYQISDAPIWVTATDGANAFLQGEAYVSISLGLNSNLIMTLASGYVTGLQSISYPATDIKPNVRIPMGRLLVTTTADPAAGAEFTKTVPAGVIWKIKAISATLVTDATVANRYPHIVFTSVGGNVIHSWSATPATASLTTLFSFAHHPAPAAGINGTTVMVAIPDEIYLPEGGTITSLTTGKVAGDNWGIASILVEEFLV